MPRRLSLKTIQRRIAQLQAQAKAHTEQKPGVAQVTKLVRKYKLTPADLRGVFSAKAPGKRRKSRLAGKKAPVRYRDGKGNKWSGRGLAPKWLKEAEKAGKKRTEFLVKA